MTEGSLITDVRELSSRASVSASSRRRGVQKSGLIQRSYSGARKR